MNFLGIILLLIIAVFCLTSFISESRSTTFYSLLNFLLVISAVKLYDHESGRKAFHSARKSTFWWINVTLSPCVSSVNWVLHDFVSSIICKFLVHKSFNIAVSTRKLHTLIIMWSNLYLPFLYFLARVIYRVLSLHVCKPWNVFRSTPLINHEIFPLPKRSCNWSLTVSRLLSAT